MSAIILACFEHNFHRQNLSYALKPYKEKRSIALYDIISRNFPRLHLNNFIYSFLWML